MVEIIKLKDMPDYAAILALWSYRQWYMTRSIEFNIVLKAYQQRAQNDDIPFSLVAVSDTMPVGMVTLKLDDLWERKDLNPWLASLYVLPEFRGQGIADILIKSLILSAGEKGYDQLYLFLGTSEVVDLEKFYLKKGWMFYDTARDNDGEETKIFRFVID